jgi:3-dehydroquinate synthase
MFVGFNLPITYDTLEVEDILETTRKDKKMDSGHIRFILLKKMGSACIDDTVTDDEIKEALAFIRYDENT